jgi:hypothetical protein
MSQVMIKKEMEQSCKDFMKQIDTEDDSLPGFSAM